MSWEHTSKFGGLRRITIDTILTYKNVRCVFVTYICKIVYQGFSENKCYTNTPT